MCRCSGESQADLCKGRVRGRPPRVGDDEDAHREAVFPLLHILERHPRAGRQVLAPRQHAALLREPHQPRRVDKHGVGQRRLERRDVGLVGAHLVPVGGLGQLRRDQLGLLLLLGQLLRSQRRRCPGRLDRRGAAAPSHETDKLMSNIWYAHSERPLGSSLTKSGRFLRRSVEKRWLCPKYSQ
eukprot:scaffold52635_cov50-Phaeocystis_antarctica.AAC.1